MCKDNLTGLNVYPVKYDTYRHNYKNAKYLLQVKYTFFHLDNHNYTKYLLKNEKYMYF